LQVFFSLFFLPGGPSGNKTFSCTIAQINYQQKSHFPLKKNYYIKVLKETNK